MDAVAKKIKKRRGEGGGGINLCLKHSHSCFIGVSFQIKFVIEEWNSLCYF